MTTDDLPDPFQRQNETPVNVAGALIWPKAQRARIWNEFLEATHAARLLDIVRRYHHQVTNPAKVGLSDLVDLKDDAEALLRDLEALE